MKIPAQEKIAELERRIQALEAQRKPVDAYSRTSVPVSPQQKSHLDRMWAHFDAMFAEMGKVFR